ncbi:PGL/p-HBAD biosynthesis glycosyltransferase [Planctomycetes bacterium Pan216]|uniref:PGL/p-HBAD biosynthesis glycosyltransferase n=1 Tax=Kolteria novifilia TaxID=2527975 RepID=A0A518B6Q2_9BACT|nr:PGL/p-HBAD biosynthesis glycosyltransferase [Planctomycetes bacterium Pan216]
MSTLPSLNDDFEDGAGEKRLASPTLAVILPVLNEEVALRGVLESLLRQSQPADRIVVVDGGSSDATLDVARAMGATLLEAPRRGRGCQIAHAVGQVREEIVLIAHADMIFPERAIATIVRTMAQSPDVPGGCLGHRFDDRHPFLRGVEWWDHCRAKYAHMSYGDQAQFFRRESIATSGGFPDQPLMEDVELSRRLRRLGRPIVLSIPVTVSARRLREVGFLRAVWGNVQLRRRYRAQGLAACQELYERYYHAAE